jgi:hypothetical protein
VWGYWTDDGWVAWDQHPAYQRIVDARST